MTIDDISEIFYTIHENVSKLRVNLEDFYKYYDIRTNVKPYECSISELITETQYLIRIYRLGKIDKYDNPIEQTDPSSKEESSS